MTNVGSVSEDSAAVQTHLGIIQAVIQRMAANSGFCKGWCITLVSAILVIAADKRAPNAAYIAAIPSILFLILDAYYLALERRFRGSYNAFVEKIHLGTVVVSDLYEVSPAGRPYRTFLSALCSLSVWLVYLMLLAMIWIAKTFVMTT